MELPLKELDFPDRNNIWTNAALLQTGNTTPCKVVLKQTLDEQVRIASYKERFVPRSYVLRDCVD